MITAVADVDQIDRRQSRFSLPRMAASYYWPCLAILGRPGRLTPTCGTR